jgi:hypothetical protein
MKVFGQRAGWAVSDVRRACWMLRRDVWAPLVRPMPRLVPGRIQSNEARDDDVLRRAVRGLHPQDVGEPSGLTGRVRLTDAAAECARGKDLRYAPSERWDPSRRPTLTYKHSADGKCSGARGQLVGARRTRPMRNMAGRWQARDRQVARREWRCERRERQQHETVYRQLRENPAPGHVRALCHAQQQPRCQNMPVEKVGLHLRFARNLAVVRERELSADRLRNCLAAAPADFCVAAVTHTHRAVEVRGTELSYLRGLECQPILSSAARIIPAITGRGDARGRTSAPVRKHAPR